MIPEKIRSISGFAKVPTKVDTVIIGAGLSGLATAYELKKAGVPFQILELTPRIGGRVRTVRYQRPGEPELYADSGMEEYWESNPAVKMLKELGLKTRSDFAASSLVLDKKLEILGAGEDTESFLKRIFSTDDLASLEAFKTKIGPMIAKIRSGEAIPADLMKLKDVAFSQWVTQQGVPKRVAEWIRISIECEIGTGWDRLSALDGIAEFHIFLGKGEPSYRVVGGNEKFTDALSKTVGHDRISVNTRVNRIETKGDEVFVTYLDQATNHSGVVRAKHVVSTIPLYRLFEVQFVPALSDLKRQAIAGQTWGSYFKAHIFVPAGAKRFWSKNNTPYMPILSDSELGVIYEGNPDQETKTKIVSLLVTGDNAESFNMLPLDRVRETIKTSFDRLWPGFSAEIKDIEFYRFHPRAIASWPVGRSRYDDLSNEVRRPENHVYLAGDFTEGTHSSGAFESAYRVSRQIIADERGLAPQRLGHGKKREPQRQNAATHE
ncbi:MAG: FAD-dependent oxidoreductase [Deltaproteobacteria bacterium]|nr:FAD-dependent oxidoreductase [Deltaproteobacteria bacterium]